jgi:hypothetical protein
MALCSDGRYNEAEELFLQVTEISSMVLGKENLGTLTSMVNLASTYREQGWWKDAEELEVQVMGDVEESAWRGASIHAG